MPTNTIDKALGIKIEKLYQSNLSNIKFKLFTKPYQFQPEDPAGLVNLANSLYKDNLKAPNWIYGNITEA